MKEKYTCEILAPAGRYSDISPLLDIGADAIYVGLKSFSSRPPIADFSTDDILYAINMVKKKNKKLYVAVNANIVNDKFENLCEELKKIDINGVDAFIISDYGLLEQAKQFIKNAQIHVSTLMGVYNIENVRWLRTQGVSRIIFSSDLFLDEMVPIIDNVPDLDYEIVADGGICFNSNRQCLLPHTGQMEDYAVYCQKEYLLYDGNNLLGRAKRIGNCPGKIHRTMGIYLGMGISSFKIEGRTNGFEYIAKRVQSMKESKDYYKEHEIEIPGYMHYIRRSGE